jgi:predicted enzyme related to lactoylglutathione lyase
MILEVMATSSEQLGIQGLGWIVRRVAAGPGALVSFYSAALGLPAPRSPGPTGSVMLWAGDLTMLEISTLAPGPGTASRVDEMSVMMGTRDFATALGRAREAGASLVAQSSVAPRAATLVDPEGRLWGLREASGQMPADPVTALPGVPGLPADLSHIVRVVVRVADPPALAAFYQRALGLAPRGQISAGGAVLVLGRGVELELRPGGHPHDPPEDRNAVPDVWILRVYDHDALAQRLRSMQVPIINQVRITGGTLSYAVDPEGHLFGIQQRTLDLLPAGRAERVEDTAARAAWFDRTD